jgi:diguanylate cyclase (GGDEF)-like protein
MELAFTSPSNGFEQQTSSELIQQLSAVVVERDQYIEVLKTEIKELFRTARKATDRAGRRTEKQKKAHLEIRRERQEFRAAQREHVRREKAQLKSMNACPVTGLLNRRGFDTTLEAVHNAGQPYAVLYIDLDEFKQINDMLTHETGDRVLKEVARRLGKNKGDDVHLARVGGDEFAIIIENCDDKDLIALATEKLTLIEMVTRKYRKETLQISASIGAVKRYPHLPETAADIVSFADKATMFGAKENGKRCVCIYQRPRTPKDSPMLGVVDRASGRITYFPVPKVGKKSLDRRKIERKEVRKPGMSSGRSHNQVTGEVRDLHF